MRISFIAILLLIVFSSTAQLKNKPGQVTEDDLKIKECKFDEEAAAVVLMDEGVADYDESHQLITSRYTKVKILKESGISLADLEVDYYSGQGLEEIIGVDIVVSNVDENGRFVQTSVDKKAIFRKKINDKWSRLSVAVPQVKVGTVIEYTYKIIGKHYGMIRDWEFQHEIPVYNSRFDLKMVPGIEMSYLVQYNRNYEINVTPNKNTSNVVFEMKNLPAMTDEPYMDAEKDYIQKVIFQVTKYMTSSGSRNYMSTWDEVFRELNGRPDFGRQIKVNINDCDDFLASVKDKADFEKMQEIFEYVQSNTKWNGFNSILSKEGVKDLWKKKTGTSGDINLCLVNLLSDAGLAAFPMLVSERGHGKVNKDNPFIEQFNNVFAVVIINGRKYYLDATDEFTPCHITPSTILNTTAYIVSAKQGGLVDINENNMRFKEVISIDSKLSEDGEYTGRVHLMSKEYARCSRIRDFTRHKGEEYITQHLLKGLGNVTVDSLKFENEDNDTLDFKQKFRYATHVQSTGDYSFINLNMFTGFENNPFVVRNRFSNVNFGYNKSTYLNCVINLPENFKVDAMPQNIKMKNPDGTVVFTRELFPDEKNHRIVARIKVDINKSLFTVDEYPELQEFYKKMIDLMNEQVVLKKI